MKEGLFDRVSSFAKKRRHHSLSKKLILIFLVLSVVSLLIVGGTSRFYFKDHFKNRVMPHLLQYLEYVRNDIGIPADLKKAKELADKLNIEIAIIDDRGIWTSTGEPLLVELVEQEYGYDHEGIHYGEFEIGEKDYAGMQVDGTTFLFTFGPVKHYKRPKALVPLFFLLLMAYVLYLATRKLFAPILQIQSGVKRIGTGELDYRLDVRRNDELGLLANDINDMAAELQKMLDAKRQLLLAVSHELRSPLTRANVAVELLENNHLKDQIKDDIQEMEKLINDILETERFSSHHNHLERAEQNINILCLEVIDTYFPQDSIQINLPEPEAIAFVDKSLFTLLLKNLIANAVKYQNKQTTLTVELVDGFLQIVVCDDGNGVEAKHLPHLTEPFYRVDPARQRQTGGYGLGLYLCRVISQAHDGEIHITSNLGEGTCVTARLLISGQFKKAE